MQRSFKDINFPNWQKVLPAIDRGGIKISFNAEYLYEIAEALGTKTVTIEVLDATSPIVVKGSNENYIEGSIGVLMPVRIK